MAWYHPPSYAPSSSPESSPASQPADSSPFSSPYIEPLNLGDEPSTIDPFAGSFSSSRSKRTNLPVRESEESRASKKARYGASRSRDSLAEDQVWADASTRAYEQGCRMFDLAEKHLTRVDVQFIRDLKSMVVLPIHGPAAGRQADTEPKMRHFNPDAPAAAARQVRRVFSRNESKNSALVPGEKDENIHLYLWQNEITKLPNELWTLENLTTLSLRGNRIAYLPPEIGNLKKLRDLNVSINLLEFLPSELNNLALVSLNVFPNPLFLEPPPSKSARPASDQEYMMPSPVPSLVELAFRVLSSPPNPEMHAKFEIQGTSNPPPQSVLEYYLPLPPVFSRSVSSSLLQTLNACSPGCIPKDMLEIREDEDASMQLAGIGRCPNPSHTAWFVHQAEQRYTWERTVAGVSVGGVVPLRWRGCSRGCLSFLEEVEVENLDAEVEFAPIGPFSGALTFDGDDSSD